MKLSNDQHLGYCTNVHPYSDVAGMVAALRDHALPLRDRLALDGPLGVGLWFPAAVAREVAADPAPLREELLALGLYCFTVNAFPHGAFHGERVKDRVFRPGWAERERLDYTLAAADALAALLPDGVSGSISTHSGGYKPWGAAALDRPAVVTHLRAAAQGLAELAARTGRHVVLALEPEPLSMLETTEEVLEFFATDLAGDAGPHLGVCFDACHQAVEYEDMHASIASLARAGIPIGKVQLSSAIVVPDPAQHADRLRPFAEDRWFHQVVARDASGALRRLPDLPDALADPAAREVAEWRVHYHVPLFADRLDDDGRLRTTRPDLEQLLGLAGPDTTLHLEIETYTFEAIPIDRRRALGAESLLDGLEQEFRWVLGRLGADASR